MNINNLEIKEYKNYKVVCNVLEEKIKSGKSKRLQLKEWQRYFAWEREGHKLRVTKIYSTPLPKVDGRKTGNTGKNPNSHNNQNGIYAKYIDITLVKFLIRVQENLGKNENMYFTTSVLAEYSHMTNMNYTTAKNNRIRFYNYLHKKNNKMNVTETKDVIISVEDTIRSVVNSALDRLQRKGIISYTKGYIIVEKEGEWKTNTRMATEEEVEDIKTWENELLEKLKTTKGKLRFNYIKMSKFYFALDNKIKIKYPNISKIFQGNEIKLLKQIEISDVKYNNAKDKLNKIVIEETMKKIERKKNKTVEEKSGHIGLENPMWEKWILDRLNDDYVSNAQYALDWIVKTGIGDIREDIKNTEVEGKRNNNNTKITKKMYNNFIKNLCNDGFNKEDAISLYSFEEIRKMVG